MTCGRENASNTFTASYAPQFKFSHAQILDLACSLQIIVYIIPHPLINTHGIVTNSHRRIKMTNLTRCLILDLGRPWCIVQSGSASLLECEAVHVTERLKAQLGTFPTCLAYVVAVATGSCFHSNRKQGSVWTKVGHNMLINDYVVILYGGQNHWTINTTGQNKMSRLLIISAKLCDEEPTNASTGRNYGCRSEEYKNQYITFSNGFRSQTRYLALHA